MSSEPATYDLHPFSSRSRTKLGEIYNLLSSGDESDPECDFVDITLKVREKDGIQTRDFPPIDKAPIFIVFDLIRVVDLKYFLGLNEKKTNST